jgi:hypothetical protein
MMLLFLWRVDGDGMEIGKSILAGLIVVRGASVCSLFFSLNNLTILLSSFRTWCTAFDMTLIMWICFLWDKIRELGKMRMFRLCVIWDLWYVFALYVLWSNCFHLFLNFDFIYRASFNIWLALYFGRGWG